MDAEYEVKIEKIDVVKMEIDEGVEDVFFEEVNPELNLDSGQTKTELVNYPIVYTTKLDDMNILLSDLRDYSAKEITDMLLTESKPKLIRQLQKLPPKFAIEIDSYMKVVGIVQQINFKTKLQAHKTRVRNSKLLNMCKPARIVLTDIKPLLENGTTIKYSESKINITKCVINDTLEILSSDEDEKTFVPDNKTKAAKHTLATLEILSSDEDKEGPISEKKTTVNYLKNKTKSTKLNISSSDEDDTALIALKTKPTVCKTQKSVLVALLHDNTAYVYRVDSNKVITDYFITTTVNDDYDFASTYPKEEKVIEQYCCWFNREDIITKICARRNYPYAVQKFFRIPHSCDPGDCHCCCYASNGCKKNKQPQKREGPVKSRPQSVTDDWVRGLLNRHQAANFGLVSKAMNYFPKSRENQVHVESKPEKYLQSTLLYIESINHKNYKMLSEFYEIGNNGDIVRTCRTDQIEQSKVIQKRYTSMMVPIVSGGIVCCWHKREKLMLDLRKAKVSPISLKFIQAPHGCEPHDCICCCRPRILPLRNILTKDTFAKHTTAYEKTPSYLTITFTTEKKSAIDENSKNKLPAAESSYTKATKNLITIEDVQRIAKGQNVNKSKDAGNNTQEQTVIGDVNTFKDLQLGVNKEGKLEAVLKTPAKCLSTAELKLLSEILSVASKQIAQLGITPEEFCKAVNSKSIVNSMASEDVEIPVTSPPQQLPNQKGPQKPTEQTENINKATGLQKQKQNTNTYTKEVTPTIATTMKSISNMYKSITNIMGMKSIHYVNAFRSHFKNDFSPGVFIQEIKKFPGVPEVITAEKPSQQTYLPKIADTFTLATTSNTIINDNVNGLRSRTIQNIDLPYKSPPESSGNEPARSAKVGMPATTTTHQIYKNVKLSLTKSTIDSPKTVKLRTIGIINQGNGSIPSATIKIEPKPSTSGIKKNTENVDIRNFKRKPSINEQPAEKKIRVKSPSKLMTAEPTLQPSVTIVGTLNNLQDTPLQIWSTPFLNKQIIPISTNNQPYVNSGAPVAVNPNTQTPAYIMGNNIVNAPNLVQIINSSVDNIYNVNGNRPSPMSNANGSMRYLAISPMTAPSNNNSILTQILQNQVGSKVLVSPSGSQVGNLVPPLVPIRNPLNILPNTINPVNTAMTPRVRTPITIQPINPSSIMSLPFKQEILSEANSNVDVEQSIHSNVIINKIKETFERMQSDEGVNTVENSQMVQIPFQSVTINNNDVDEDCIFGV